MPLAAFKVLLQPVGDLPLDVSSRLKMNLPLSIPGSYELSSMSLEPPALAQNKRRGQWLSSAILDFILIKTNAFSCDKVLGICDLDAYSPGLNFVFGEAHLGGRVAAIYLARLRQEFYHLPRDDGLFFLRVIKEAAHELGHSLGLGHCPNPACVMRFSNSLSDTDRKAASFCSSCRLKIIGPVRKGGATPTGT